MPVFHAEALLTRFITEKKETGLDSTEHQVHLLLVEDDQDHVELIRRAFQFQGKPVNLSVAGNLLEAQAYLANHIPDLVIADLHISGGKGTDLLAAPDEAGTYPLVIMTSQGDEQMAVDAMKSGALDYVVKTEETLAEMPGLVDRILREWKTILMRREAEEAVRISEAKFQDLYDHAPDMFLSVDLQTGIILQCNQTLVVETGLRMEEILERPFSTLFHPECMGDVLHALRIVLTNGAMRNLELQLNRQDGSVIDVSMNMSAVCDERGRILYARAICRDITELKHVEEALHQTKERLNQARKLEALGTLAGGIAHDFNNMLVAIIGYTQLTLKTISPNTQEGAHLQQVLNAGGRAKDLVKQILAFSRQAEPHRIPVQLDVIAKEVLQLIRATLSTTIEISQDLPENLGTVLADPTQMHQVIVNLCTNADHAMRDCGGRLDVRLDVVHVTEQFAAQHQMISPGSHLRLTVSDTGHGIPPEILDRIFEPFFTTKPVGEGTGMGLSVIHGILTSHNGAITVENTPGQGATFSVYLPRISLSSALTVEKTESNPVNPSRVLFVEDEESLAQLGQEMLKQLGCEVVARTSSVEALETFRVAPNSYDVVITDQSMPHLTGEILARELLKIRPNLPIILCTGFSHTMCAEKAKALGIKAYLEKPFFIEDLALALVTVRGVLPEPQG